MVEQTKRPWASHQGTRQWVVMSWDADHAIWRASETIYRTRDEAREAMAYDREHRASWESAEVSRG